MNKTILFASALLCAGCFIASCSNDDEEIVNVQPTNKTVTIHAGISEDAATRIALGESVDGKTKVLWSAGDAFSLVNGENTYTFSRAADDTEEVANADFSYTGTETLPDLSTAGLSFSYPATGVSANYAYQTGTEEGLSNYMVMTATIPEGASWDNLHLSFKHNTAVVKITLTNEVFKDKDVIVSLNATGLLEDGTKIKSDLITADENGMVTAYFAVPATDELSDCNVQAICDNVCYSSTLGAKSITAGKLYKVSKNDMEAFANVVTLTEAGTLSTLISEDEKYTITSLIVCGDLNGTDISYIQNMSKGDGSLIYLDLSDANIVAGGSSYDSYNKKDDSGDCDTEDNVIGKHMFRNCKFETIILPCSATEISSGVLAGCENLTSVTIPNNIQTIDFSNSEYGNPVTFENCPLINIILDDDNPYFSVSDGVLFNKDKTKLLKYLQPNRTNNSYTIPETVTCIGESAFYKCINFTSINIPNTVTSIEEYAFSGCTSVTQLNLSNKLTTIPQYTFRNCGSNADETFALTIHEGVTRIDKEAFHQTPIKELHLPSTLTYIGYLAFIVDRDYSKSATAIYCAATNPPFFYDSYSEYWIGTNLSICILYVPKGSEESYTNSQYWPFTNIVGFDF